MVTVLFEYNKYAYQGPKVIGIPGNVLKQKKRDRCQSSETHIVRWWEVLTLSSKRRNTLFRKVSLLSVAPIQKNGEEEGEKERKNDKKDKKDRAQKKKKKSSFPKWTPKKDVMAVLGGGHFNGSGMVDPPRYSQLGNGREKKSFVMATRL